MKRLAAGVLTTALLVAACASGPPEYAGVVRSPAPDVSAATLPDVLAGGAPFRFVAPEDGLLIVHFGYTSCPDVCPTTMANVRSALELLGDDAERVSVAFVTVDPGRDSDDILATYVGYFTDGGHGLRTDDPTELRAVADAFGADYSVTGTAPYIEVEHTADLYAVDDRGRIRLTWPFGTRWQDVAGDLVALLGEEKT